MKITWKIGIKCALCLAMFALEIRFAEAQNLGGNIMTNGDFGKLPGGTDMNTYRRQYSNDNTPEEGEEFYATYLSSGNFSHRNHQYVLAAKMNAFYADWKNITVSDGGLMMIVEGNAAKVGASEHFYKRTFYLPGGHIYHFSLEVCNVWNQQGHGFWNTLRIFDPWIAVNYNSKEYKTDQIGYKDGWVKLEFDVVIPDEGKAIFEYYVGHTSGGTGLGGDAWGTDFAMDNLKLEPYLLTSGPVLLDACQVMSAGSVTLTSSVAGGPSGNETKYGRWMKRAKGGNWEWTGDIQPANYSLTLDTTTFRASDYRILYSFSKSLLGSFATPPSELSDNYAFSEIFAGRELPALALGVPGVVCKTGTLQNTGTVSVACPAGISEFSWRIDDAPATTIVCPAGQNRVDVNFDFGETDQTFQIISYRVPDFCKDALPLSGLTFSLKPLYIPNTVSGDINAPGVVLCSGEEGVLEAEAAYKTIRNPEFCWYDNAQLTGEPLAKTTTIPLSSSLAEGIHHYYVTLKATNRCPSVPGAAKEIRVSVNPFTVADELTVAGELTVCEKEPLALTAGLANEGSVGDPQFEWYRSPDWAAGDLLATGGFYTGDSFGGGEHHLFVRMKGDNRCFNLAGTGKEVIIQVTPRADAGDITIEGDARICLADALNLTAGASDGENITRPVFKWYRDADLTEPETEGVTGDGTSFSLSGLEAGQHAWYVTLTGDEVCENWPGTALQVPVVVLDSFVLPVIPSDTVRIFKDDDAVLSLDIEMASALQYEWYASSDLSGKVLGRDNRVTIPGLGEGIHLFYVRIKDGNACWSRAVEMPVRVYPPSNIRVDHLSLCQGNSGELMLKTTLTDLTIAWSDKEDNSNVLGRERSLPLPADLTVGEHMYYVQVTDNTNGLTMRQAVKVTVIPRAAIAGSALDSKAVLCVGNELNIPFAILTDAVQYKIRLKSSTLADFEFSEYTSPVTPEMLAAGKLPVAFPAFVIPAEMNGFDFVLSVELIGRSNNIGGKIETCSAVRDFAFAVQKLPEITVDEPEIICSGGALTLASFIELNGNELLGVEWRAETESGEVVLSTGRTLQLTDLTKEWNGRRLWLRLQTGCGWTESNRVMLRVYSNDFNTINYSGGDVYPGMMVEVGGNSIPLNGLLYSWEYKTFFGEWARLDGKNTASVYASVEITGLFRRIVTAGECGGVSNEVEIRIADYSDSTGTDEGLGRYVYQETFGYVSEFEWARENGDKRDVSTYRKFDHTRGINTSKYSVHHYEMKPEAEWEESVNDTDRLPEENPLLFYSGDWVFKQTTTNTISEPWTKYKNNPAFVWCTDNMLLYNSRTGYVENGTYCAGNGTVTQPVRWFNINGSWKMGYWRRNFYTGKSPGMGDGKYALSPCPYQLDPGAAFVKYSKSADHTPDPAGESGLMLVVNSADEDAAYSGTITKLTGGMWYRFEAYVANPEAGGLNAQPNIKAEIAGTGVTGENGLANPSVTSGSLGRGDALAWTRCTLNFFVPEGVNQVKFSISNTNGSGAGNVFVLDDISVRELLVKNWHLAEDFCVQPGDVRFTLTNESAFPDYAVVYSRLMRSEKNSGHWEWLGGISDSMKLVAASEWAVNHDFRVVEAFSASLLDQIDPDNLAAANALGYYAVTEKYEIPEFCLGLSDYKVDYTAVTDSVKIIPEFTGQPWGADICSRFLFRRFGSEAWEWYGNAGINYISWIDMLEGDYRVVYGFSDRLLNQLSAADIQSKTAYYVSSDIISGVSPSLTIVEKIGNGQVTLKPEIEGLPMGAQPCGCWMKRARGTDDWMWLPMNRELSYSASLFVYSAEEYRFVYTQSQALIDTLAVGNVAEGGRGYLVSDIWTGKGYRIGELTADFCSVPGSVVQNLAFSSEYPESVEMHGRWMQKEKDGEAWGWMSDVVYGLPDFEVSMSDYLTHDYRLVLSWSRDSLRNWEAGQLPVENSYYRVGGLTNELPVCIRIDTIRVASVGRGKFELLPEVSCDNTTAVLYGRWLKAPAGTDVWEWVNEDMAEGTVKLPVTTDELREYDYRYLTAFDGGLPADAGRIPAKPYFTGEAFGSVNVWEPSLAERQVVCVPGRDSNRVELSFVCPDEITTLTYCMGTGEIRTDSLDRTNKISFEVGADEMFCLLHYAQEGFCDRIVLDDTVNITYKPRPVMANMTDVFTCLNNEVCITPQVTGIGELRKNWYRGEESEPFSSQDTLRMRMDRPDTLEIRLAVSGDEVCPAEGRVHVIAADYPEMIQDGEVNQICVGEPFRLNYQSTTAGKYRVVLKESSMPGFSLYSEVTDIREKENAWLEIYSGQAPLFATEFMAGHEFTFRVQIYRYVEFNGVSYRCDNEFDAVFKVSPKPASGYAGDIYACMNESLNLNPVVEPNGNPVTEYVWRLWNGDSVRTDKVLTSSETDAALTAVVDADWQGKRLQLAVMCDCGEIVVQDIPLHIFDNGQNIVSAPAGIVLSGENVHLTGSEMKTEGIGYQWEYKSAEEGWKELTGETAIHLNIRAPETTTVYRRRIISDVYACEGRAGDSVLLNVYNNELENTISLAPADTLVNTGSVVHVSASVKVHDGVEFVWQKNDDGRWVDAEPEDSGDLSFLVEEMTMIRRRASFGEKQIYSNVVLVNVYDARKNQIMAPVSVVLPGERVSIIGNCFNLAGVAYGWWMNPGSTGKWTRIAGADSWNLESGLPESALYKRYVYLPTGDTLESNEVRITVFDNARDNVISCPELNVCQSETIQVTGKEIGGMETVYRWEYSVDGGDFWEVLDGQHGASLNYTAEKSLLLRRFVVVGHLEDSFSNVLDLNVVHVTDDNVIAFTGIVLSGRPAEIRGNEVKNAVYIWERSNDGENGWQVIAGASANSLLLDAGETAESAYFRRILKFEEGGCETVSRVVKMVIMDQSRNRISAPGKPVCQWSEIALTGEDLSDVGAKYQWYCNRGTQWVACEYAFEKDLTVYEGIGENTDYRRDVTVDGEVYESNVVRITVLDGGLVNNAIEQPEAVCAGGEIVLKGSRLSPAEWDGYIKGYYWEKSVTAAGGSWERVDSINTADLTLKNVEEPEWYCRIVTTYCGNDLRSEPVLLEVKDALRFTLRNDAPFGSLNPKEPIRISIDEDDFRSYEIEVDGQLKASGPEYLFYGWSPKKYYRVVGHVVSSTGCTQTDTINMFTPDVDLPNVLTPNNDGYNDLLLKGYELKVYNRWGNLLYNGRDGWEGRFKGSLVAAGTYFYVVKIGHSDGSITEYRKSVTVKE